MSPRCLLPAAVIATLAALGGCNHQAALAPQPSRQQLEDDLRKLQEEAARLRRQLADRDRQVAELLALDGPKRIEKLYLVQRVGLGRATGGVDLDGRPGDDAVKVYLEPIDQHGSVIKAPGEVAVQLYDLAAPKDQTLLAECRFDLDAVAKAWSSGFIAYHYHFTCPWQSAPPAHDQITVRVEFLDYLTGRRFAEQKVVKVALPPAPATSAPAAGPGT